MAEKKKKAVKVRQPSTGDYLRTLGDMLVVNPRNSPAATIGGAAYDYATKSTPKTVVRDIRSGVQGAEDWLRKQNKALRANPVTAALQMLKAGYIDPLADPYRVFQQAATERSRGNEAGGAKLAAMVPLSVAGVLPQVRGAGNVAAKAGVEAATKTAKKATPSLKVTPKPKQLALPAPPKQLALPAPGPGLPPFAVKPRGGQFYPDVDIQKEFQGDSLTRNINELQGNFSPEAAARFVSTISANDPTVQTWLERTLAKYYKTDFGSPDDPLRSLAERGLHYETGMTPERWQRLAKDYIVKDDIGSFTIPGQPNINPAEAAALLEAAPWLAKQPVTDKLYGISGGGLEVSHLADELKNALNAETSGLPPELALRPESLDRMSFAAAAERVGRINQFRAKEMERAGLSNLDSPAVQTFKEYADDNPMGLRWTELKTPSEESGLFKIVAAEDQGVPFHYVEDTATGERTPIGGTREDALRQAQEMYGRDPLQQALKYEGDTMGHCVGGYCPDVMSGRSRIFSLRDAKGEPHVTIETRPGKRPWRASDIPRDVEAQLAAQADILAKEMMQSGYMTKEGASERAYNKLTSEWLSKQPTPADDIIQIKGKQNRAPKDDYLPFVQDFVKSGQWSNVGDFGNTGLVKLPDGRYITQQQLEEVVANNNLDTVYGQLAGGGFPRQFPRDPSFMNPEDWAQFQQNFEGFAVGGRVSADRCFSRHPMSVKQ
jgi:hypothetical protein